MKKRSLNAAGLAVCAGLFPSTSQADVTFPRGSCAVVVASRSSIAAAQDWIEENRWGNLPSVYLSENGWYAITVTVIEQGQATAHLRAAKADGRYPQDAYCSTGESYVREVSWRGGGSNSAPDTMLWMDFDARPLSRNDKAFLQAALALQGDYNGMIDGSWGRGSQSALERYTRREFQREPTNADSAFLAFKMLGAIEEDGWRRDEIGGLGYTLVAPMNGLSRDEKNGLYSNWKHDTKNIYLTFNDFKASQMRGIHAEFLENPENIGAPYTVRRDRTWITSVRRPGISSYVRSDLYLGTWSSILIGAGADQVGELALMTASIEIDSEGLFLLDDRGALDNQIIALAKAVAEASEGETDAPPRGAAESSPDEGPIGTGTGFYINDEGVLLTNAHVVEECARVTVDGAPAEIISVSSTFDIAAVKSSSAGGTPLPFAREEAGLNADITIAGYPLHGLLGGLNVSRGSISAMKGLGGDETSIQISAPVQPGNSGGPMIDRYGNVAGVVVAKLDAMEVASVTGDIAQNVNFAIRGSMAKIFMQTNRIDYLVAGRGEPLLPEDAAQRLQAATRLIECISH